MGDRVSSEAVKLSRQSGGPPGSVEAHDDVQAGTSEKANRAPTFLTTTGRMDVNGLPNRSSGAFFFQVETSLILHCVGSLNG